MKIQYRIEGKAVTTRYYDDKYQAWEKYVRAADRQGLRDPMHIPGGVCGDAQECDGSGTIHAVRDGHATITLRVREIGNQE